jgi:cob(I)alamin adenosyltransferase
MAKLNVTTKTGDDGKTTIIPGTRISKGSLEIEYVGTLDEIQVSLGAIEMEDVKCRSMLDWIQKRTFLLATCIYDCQDCMLNEEDIQKIEDFQKHLMDTHDISNTWHLTTNRTKEIDKTRVAARTAERICVRIMEEQGEHDSIKRSLIFLNRLSDFLWVMGRVVEKKPHYIKRSDTGERTIESFNNDA